MKIEKELNPEYYIAKADPEGQRFSLICKGSPLTAYVTRNEALSKAKHFKLNITLVWDGFKGKFESLEGVTI